MNGRIEAADAGKARERARKALPFKTLGSGVGI
jgi:hypothetical protein